MPQADCTEASTAAILRMEAIATGAGSYPWIEVGQAVGSIVVGYNIVAAEAVGNNFVVDSLCIGAVGNNTAVVVAVGSLCTGTADSNSAVAVAVDSLCIGAVDNNTVVVVAADSLCSEAVGSSTAVVAAIADNSDNKAAH